MLCRRWRHHHNANTGEITIFMAVRRPDHRGVWAGADLTRANSRSARTCGMEPGGTCPQGGGWWARSALAIIATGCRVLGRVVVGEVIRRYGLAFIDTTTAIHLVALRGIRAIPASFACWFATRRWR